MKKPIGRGRLYEKSQMGEQIEQEFVCMSLCECVCVCAHVYMRMCMWLCVVCVCVCGSGGGGGRYKGTFRRGENL